MNSIPIVADIPTPTPGLGFPEYVDALADAVRGGEPPQFTIGLYGAWGSGKSSLLGAIAENLTGRDSFVLPVLFDAWRHERADHIVVPLLFRVIEAAKASGNVPLTKHLERALKALVFSLNFKVAGVGVDTSAMRDTWQESGFTSLEEAFAKPFEELRGIPKILGDRRVAVLIDDLDRCSPEKVVSLLEAINLVMDIRGFIFVLALDYEVLINAVSTRYPHVSGHEFIEKMVQLPFRVPPLTAGADEFLEELIPNWRKRSREFPRGFAESVIAVADLGLRTNPRQIKRLINSFLLLDRIIDRRGLEVDERLVAAMIGLQLRWPDRYEDLQQAVLSGDQQPFDVIKKTDDPQLTRYADQLFHVTPASASLRQLLQLTAVTASEPVQTMQVGPVRKVQAEKQQWLLEHLAGIGFKPSARSARIWTHPDLDNFRLLTQKTSLRFERKEKPPAWAARDAPEWVQIGLAIDYRLAEEAIALITREVAKPGSLKDRDLKPLYTTATLTDHN